MESSLIQKIINLPPISILALCILGLIYIIYKIETIKLETKEINKAVNHKGSDEPTLREAVMELRESEKVRHGDIKDKIIKVDKKVTKVVKKVKEHDKRIDLIEMVEIKRK